MAHPTNIIDPAVIVADLALKQTEMLEQIRQLQAILGTSPPIEARQDHALSPDGGCLRWFGHEWYFQTELQAAIITELYESWLKGWQELRRAYLCKASGAGKADFRPKRIFAGTPAWGRAIGEGSVAGSLRLIVPENRRIFAAQSPGGRMVSSGSGADDSVVVNVIQPLNLCTIGGSSAGQEVPLFSLAERHAMTLPLGDHSPMPKNWTPPIGLPPCSTATPSSTSARSVAHPSAKASTPSRRAPLPALTSRSKPPARGRPGR